MKRYIEWIIRYRFAVLAVTMLLTALAVYQTRNLRVVIDMNATLPQSHPFISTTNEVEKVFGSKYVVVIGITPKEGDIYQPAVLEKVQRISTAMLGARGVVPENLLSLSARRSKDIIGTADGLEVKPLMASVPSSAARMAALKEAVERNPVYKGSIVSRDGRTTAILAEFREPAEADGFRSIIKQVEAIVDPQRDASVDISIGGLPSYLASIESYSDRMGILVPLAIAVLSLVLFAAFRTKQGLFLPLATAILALIWGIGVMGTCGIPMDAFNATTPLLILAVATGHAVQMLKRYYEEYQRLLDSGSASSHEANNQAIVTSISRVAPVMIAAGMVAAIGFFSLVVFDISTVRTFGIFTGIGILAALILELTFIPALRSILKPPARTEGVRSDQRKGWGALTDAISGMVTGSGRPRLYAGCAVLVAFFGMGMAKIVMDNAIKSFFADDTHVAMEDVRLNERLGGTNTLYLLVEGKEADAIKNPKTLQAMDALQRYLDAQPNVSKTISIADFIKRMNQSMHADDPAAFKVPDSRELISQYLLLYSVSGEPGDFNSYVDYDYRMANLTVFLRTDSSAYIEKLVADISTFAEKNFDGGVNVRIGGSVTQGAALSKVMVRGKILNIVQIGAVVFLVSAFIFRSVVAGLFVLLPLLIAVMVNFGLMGWTGIPLNIPTSLTSAMAVGIGADYAIYLIYRLREEMATGLDETTAIRSVIKTAGAAVLFVAVAVAAGYGVLMFSVGFNIHKWLSILIATAMMSSALAALLLIPALILTFKPAFVFRKRPSGLGPVPASMAAVALSIGLLAALGDARAAEVDLAQLVAKNASVTKVPDSSSEATITLTNKAGQERIRRTFNTTKLQENGMDNMRMTRFMSPADVKGTVSLLIERSARDDDIWIYLPALKKVRRLSASNKKDSFVGTDFSNADVLGYKVEEWNYRLLREEEVDGKVCHVVEATPKADAVKSNTGYSRRIDWIRKDNAVTVRSEYWDEAGQALKSARYKDVRLVDERRGRWQPMLLEASNLQTGHRTVIQFENFKVNLKVGDEFFTTRYMEKEQ